MAWRFEPSKFKNTAPKMPKKEDTIFDLPIGSLSCVNNGIQCSDSYLAFHIEGEGGKLGVLPIGTKGRKLRKDIGIVCAHGDLVDDFSLMPYDSSLMVTCSRDDKVKLWRLNGDSHVTSTLSAEIDVDNGTLLGSLRPHSTAANIVAVTGTSNTYVLDIEQQKTVLQMPGLIDKGLSLDWSPDGVLLAVSSDKGRRVTIYDPRTGNLPIETLSMHQGLGREGRLLFCGQKLLSSGFTNMRAQEVRLVDSANWKNTVFTQEFLSTTGVLIPHYDDDTKLVYLAGKGTNKMFLMEIQQRQPVLSSVYQLTLPEQTLGSCLGSKRKVTVMDGEVGTFYQLTKTGIIPVPCIVPRRSYRDFHACLYPDTIGSEAGCTSFEWLNGTNAVPARVSMAPDGLAGNSSPPPQEPTPPVVRAPVQVAAPVMRDIAPEPAAMAPLAYSNKNEEKPQVRELDYSIPNEPKEHVRIPEKHSEVNTPLSVNTDIENQKPSLASAPKSAESEEVRLRVREPSDSTNKPRRSPRDRPKTCVIGMVASKFRHLETVVGIKANNAVFSNMRNVNTRLPTESNGSCCSSKYIAVPLSGPAGVIGIYDVDVPEKIPDGVMDGVFNKAQVTDLHWNPFDDGELAVATDVGVINIWKLSTEDGPRNEMEPNRIIKVGGEKIVCLRYHPLASNLIAIALSDSSIELWDTVECVRKLRIVSHTAAVLSLAWSSDGRYLVSVSRDCMLNVHQPQLGSDCLIRQKKVLESTRAARVLFGCEDRLIILVSLTRSSGRQVQLLDTLTLSAVYTQQIDSATQPLIPHYDYDSSVLFLSGKGDRILNMFEVCYDSPYLLPLTNYMASAGSQAIAFHNKSKCDVMAVEFQRSWRLTEKSLEQMIFRVPRVKKDVFQSELFPDALLTWSPTLTSSEWLSGDERPPRFQSLKPDGVHSQARPVETSPLVPRASVADVSLMRQNTIATAPVAMSPIQATQQHEATSDDPSDQKKYLEKKVEAGWSAMITTDNQLEQDRMEGVAEEEWH